MLRLPRTPGLAILIGASFFGYFALISGSPFALIDELHVTSTQFAIAFAINASSVAGFVVTWTVYAFGMAFIFPTSFAALLVAARADAGLAAGLLGATQMLFGAAGSALAGMLPGATTSALGLSALIGSVAGTIGYAASRPALGQQRQLAEAGADDR